jgi:hypothetical protein
MPGKTMSQTRTVASVYVVVQGDGTAVLETEVLADALAAKRKCGGRLERVDRDLSPS